MTKRTAPLAAAATLTLLSCGLPDRVPGLPDLSGPPASSSTPVEEVEPSNEEDVPSNEAIEPERVAPGIHGLASMHRDLELYASGGEPGVDVPLERLTGDRAGRYAFKLEAGAYRLCHIPTPQLFEDPPIPCVDVVLGDGEAVRWDICDVNPSTVGGPEYGFCAPEGPPAAAVEPACPTAAGLCGQLFARYDDYPALDGVLHDDDRMWPLVDGALTPPAVLSSDGAYAVELQPGEQTICFLEAIGGPFSCATVDVPSDRPARVDVCVGDCERWTGEDIVEVFTF